MTQFDSNRENGHDRSIDPIDCLEFSRETGKRAVYEEYEFRPLGGGHIEVANLSHGDAGDEHTYVVDVVSGLPSSCACPADQYHDGACKHRVAVALRPPLLEAAEAGCDKPPLLADGGQVATGDTDADGGSGRLEWDDVDGDDGAGYTEHVEPSEQGGETYVRCEGCGRELLTCLGGRDNLLHVEGCPNAREEADRR